MADNQSDAMISRLEGELEERNAFIQGTIASAQDADRDLSDNETELIRSARSRVESVKGQLDMLYETRSTTIEARQRARDVQTELTRMRRNVDSGPVEYRSAGAYMLDSWKASIGDREASGRLETFQRAADHQTTLDNPGIIPDPVVGPVINFVDQARPLVSALGPVNMPSSTWHRPKVTQHTVVGPQGEDGSAQYEKAELVSQKMKIVRLEGSARTYGGYVNVSRQDIDFSNPQALDMVVSDLSGQYAVTTEQVTADEMAAEATGETVTVDYGSTENPQDAIAAAVWDATAQVWDATKGQGRLLLAVSSSTLRDFGPLFQPVAPTNAQGGGFTAAGFGPGTMGSISGIQVLMSSGLAPGSAYLFSTAAIEVYEQRVGALQVIEPSVLGVQVAYAGYFTPLVIEGGGIVPIDTGAGS